MKNSAVVAAIFTSLFTGTTTAATIYDNSNTRIELGGRSEPRFNLSKENEFNKSLHTYIGYRFQQLDAKDDKLQAGIRYDF